MSYGGTECMLTLYCEHHEQALPSSAKVSLNRDIRREGRMQDDEHRKDKRKLRGRNFFAHLSLHDRNEDLWFTKHH